MSRLGLARLLHAAGVAFSHVPSRGRKRFPPFLPQGPITAFEKVWRQWAPQLLWWHTHMEKGGPGAQTLDIGIHWAYAPPSFSAALPASAFGGSPRHYRCRLLHPTRLPPSISRRTCLLCFSGGKLSLCMPWKSVYAYLLTAGLAGTELPFL